MPDSSKEISLTPLAARIELEKAYAKLCRQKHNIAEHLPVLRTLASDPRVVEVVEFGTGRCRSTVALLLGCGIVTTYDLVKPEELEAIQKLADIGDYPFRFVQADTMTCDLDQVDMLFIDDEHTFDQVTAELRKFGDRVTKFIVLHDTVSHPDVDGAARLWLKDKPEWEVLMDLKNNNGLLVLQRREPNE